MRKKTNSRKTLDYKRNKIKHLINTFNDEEIYEFNKFLRFWEVIKKDRNWDFDFILDLLKAKLIDIRDYYKKSGYQFTYRSINMALGILDIYKREGEDREGHYKDRDYLDYVNTKNAKRYFGKRELEYLSKGENSCLKSSLRKRKSWHVLWLYFEHRMETWWD